MEIPRRLGCGRIGLRLKQPREVKISQFNIIREKVSERNPMLVEQATVGEPILLITGNMPTSLREQIEEIIANHCKA